MQKIISFITYRNPSPFRYFHFWPLSPFSSQSILLFLCFLHILAPLQELLFLSSACPVSLHAAFLSSWVTLCKCDVDEYQIIFFCGIRTIVNVGFQPGVSVIHSYLMFVSLPCYHMCCCIYSHVCMSQLLF